ncbi:HET domain-containing protein [Rhexocercosporidium sp. MPI-PUGE-AT-0058]|nr:HET domain-containing protein [Rhexocercosporidium sp. MPI-PUGE-AT-0058]
MKLINTKTLFLHDLFDTQIPEYAILSHTWGDEEISFQDWRILEANRPPSRDTPPQPYLVTCNEGWVSQTTQKAGYKKIIDFCRLCRQDGYSWAWVDTCCIDKSSSAELSEAINSMYKWYSHSRLCYVFLTDVSASRYGIPEVTAEDDDPSAWGPDRKLYSGPVDYDCYKRAGFASSRWFKRGWTLQELLAPSRVHFYDRDWKMIGTRFQLGGLLADITKIPAKVASYPFDNELHMSYSIAERFSWASSRGTSRQEDVAYCLLGIFNVHLPLLYGEGGTRAFRRLQDEIIKRSTDHSILVWFVQDQQQVGDNAFNVTGPLLAESPKAFQNCGNLMCDPDEWDVQMRHYKELKKSYAITNNGLDMELPIVCQPCPDCFHGCRIALLDCWTPHGERLGIHIGSVSDTGQFERKHCDTVATIVMDESGLIEGHSPDIQKIYLTIEGHWMEEVD